MFGTQTAIANAEQIRRQADADISEASENAAPQGALFDAYVDIAAARASAGDIGLAGLGLDVLEGQLEAFSTAAAAGTVSAAEAAVEAVATPIVVAAA